MSEASPAIPPRRRRRVLAVAAAALLAAVAAVGSAAWWLLVHDPPAVPAFARVKEEYRLSEAVLLDRRGEVIHTLRIDPTGRRLPWTALADISPALVRAVLRAEDRRFRTHGGIDWRAAAGAAYTAIATGRLRGASTITMQLAAKLDAAARPHKGRRGWREKVRQVRGARALERAWTKDEILEAYLNLITFRGELQGVAAASRALFDKDPSGLDDTESALLAALIPSAGTSLDAVAARAAALSQSSGGTVPPGAVRSRIAEILGRPYRIRTEAAFAPHVAQLLLKEPGMRVVCTLDGRVQRAAGEVLRLRLAELDGRNVRDGAVLVADNASGDVLAYLGNSGAAASAPHVDGIRALRLAGSTLKPFLYGLALERRLLTVASLVEDAPLQIPTPLGLYVPENYNRTYLGAVSVRTALASSLNIPAVRTLMLVGGEPFVRRLRAAGLASVERDADYYGYALALGSVDVRLWDLVTAYRTLANGGRFSPLRLRPGEKTGRPRRVMDGGAAFLVTDILADRAARSATFGLENVLATPFFTAVKTGTSKDMRDNWCVGYSERYTVGVWVGNFSGEPMWNVSGVSGAAPVWLDIMRLLHGTAPSRAPRPPPGVAVRPVSFAGGIEPDRQEWFIAGTEPPAAVTPVGRHERPAIVYPPDGAIIALDPDIPHQFQDVALEAAPAGGDFRWRLGERDLGRGNPLLWKPQPGDHALTLVGGDGRPLATVRFTVR